MLGSLVQGSIDKSKAVARHRTPKAVRPRAGVSGASTELRAVTIHVIDLRGVSPRYLLRSHAQGFCNRSPMAGKHQPRPTTSTRNPVLDCNCAATVLR